MRSTLTSKGQITIPIALRRKLRLKSGDVLDFDENAPFLKATKKVDVKRMRSTLGRGKRTLRSKTAGQWMDYLRGPMESP
jgi:AbrB family looped-hinge helix DNA binding protein